MKTGQKITIKPNLTTHSLIPENQEAPIHFLPQNVIPDQYFYLRNHLYYPMLTCRSFLLPVIGEVKKPMIFHFMNLLNMPSKFITSVLECSGNKRAYFEPRVYGVQWKEGAIYQGSWKGVPLKYLLDIAGVKDTAVEVVFEGYDIGPRTDIEGLFSFVRSLPIDKALHPDTIIAYELNGKPILYKHGYPMRLIVPDWYGMASVKWLKRIIVIDHEFKGPFQTVDYVYYPHKHDDKGKRPVTTMNVNSIIQYPTDYAELSTGTHIINGIAYTGKGTITHVDISFDEGATWKNTKLYQDTLQPYSWTPWTYTWNTNTKGDYTIMVRAADSSGNIQPPEAEWNRKGYGYNEITKVHVKIE